VAVAGEGVAVAGMIAALIQWILLRLGVIDRTDVAATRP
jgi:hypothetical protein